MGNFTPGVSGMDTTFRNWLKAPTAAGRHTADAASSDILAAEIAEPVTRDVLVKGAAEHDWRGALGSGVIDATAQAFSFGLNMGAKYGFQAAGLGTRPLAGPCLKDPSYDPYCGTPEVTLGMPSGHSQAAWTTVGLALSHHLWDHEASPSWLELGALTLAAGTTQTLRIVADKHTATQTIVGSALGLGVGIAVPGIAQAVGLGYDHWNSLKLSQKPSVVPFVSPSPTGCVVGVQGTF